jgi:flagellar protein FlaG
MDTNAKVSPVQPATEPDQHPSTPESTPAKVRQSLPASPNVPAYIAEPLDYRLVVDKDPVSGAFIYRTVDRVSGETVSQFPSEEIVKLRDSADYQAGTVFNGKV